MPTRGDDLYEVTISGLNETTPGTSDISDVINGSGYQEAVIRITAGTITAGTEDIILIASDADGSNQNVIPEDAGTHKRASKSSTTTNAGYCRIVPPFIRVAITGGATITSDLTVELVLRRVNVRE